MSAADHTLWNIESKLTGVLVKPGYIHMVGDRVAAQLLSQIVYWFKPGRDGKTKLRIRRNGRLCLVKHRADLACEAGISLKQYTRAIRILIEKGFVSQEVHLFKGRTAPHTFLNMSLLEDHLEGLVTPKAEQGGKTPKSVVPSGHMQSSPEVLSTNCPLGTPITESNKKIVSDTSIAAASQAAGSGYEVTCAESHLGDEDFDPSFVLADLDKLKKAGLAQEAAFEEASALAARYAISKAESDAKACTHALLFLWRKEVKENYKWAPPVTFSPKQVGKMKYVLRSLVAGGLDPAAVVRDSIRNWGRLIWLIAEESGLPILGGEEPSLDSWSRHYDHAARRFIACGSADDKKSSIYFARCVEAS